MARTAAARPATRPTAQPHRPRQTPPAAQQQGQQAQLGEAAGVVTDLEARRGAHAAAVDSTAQTNTEQQSTAGGAIDALAQGAQEGLALATLVGSLHTFRGMADLFSHLPGSLGDGAAQASADCIGLIDALQSVSGTEAVQGGISGGQETMQTDAGRIAGVSAQAAGTDQMLGEGGAQVASLAAANAGRMAETQASATQAAQEGAAAAASGGEAESTHDTLLARMQGWADVHQQARETAIEEALVRFSALGYTVEALP